MGFFIDVKRCSIFNEFSLIQQKEYFSLSRDKVIHNIDTLYFSCFLNETTDKLLIADMVESLKISKENLLTDKKTELEIAGLTLTLSSFSIYSFCFRLENMYDIFLSSYLPNGSTPRIVIQLRSIGLWLDGAEELINTSFEHLKSFLAHFGISSIAKVQENRLDYAYHTNSIQNPYKYFGDKSLMKNLKTSLKKYHKVGDIGRQITIDYFSLGMRSSNNIFFRCYNKTKEVIEMNYKSFFIDYWFKNGLISSYDKYCLEFAYKKGTFNSLVEGRCNWYLEHGIDAELKKQIAHLLGTCVYNSDNFEFLIEFITGKLPEVTIIMNAEFQTKRKFYTTFEETLGTFSSNLKSDNVLHRVLSIVLNRKVVLDYLTEHTVFFNGAWWKRIQSCKISGLNSDSSLIREYSSNLDRNKVQYNLLKNVASLSIYDNNLNDNDLDTDFSILLCNLNDNDVYGKPILLDSVSGEQLRLEDYRYSTIKRKKNKQLKGLLK